MFPLAAGLIVGTVLFLGASIATATETAAGPSSIKPPLGQIFTFFVLMLGPIKIIGPFAKITQAADTAFSRKLAFKAILYSCLGLLFAALIGHSILEKLSVPMPVLAVAGGIVLFLVALQTVLQQYNPPAPSADSASAPSLRMAMTPLAFPTIVTPYGIAVLIIFVSLNPDIQNKLIIGGILLGVMLLNFIAMMLSRHILRFLGVFLQILGSVLGILQIALGLQLIVHNLRLLMM